MARGKPNDKPARIAAGPASPAVARSLGETAGKLIRPILPLVLVAGCFGGAAYALWIPVKEDPNAKLTKERIADPLLGMREMLARIPEAEQRKLAQLRGVAEGRSVFEPGLAGDVAKAYEANPWIEKVGLVRVRYPAALSVEQIDTRFPFARLDTDGGYFVVDHKGHVLPMAAGDLGATPAANTPVPKVMLPSLAGVKCKRVGAGEAVKEPEALEGLAVLQATQEVFSRAPGNLKCTRAQRDPAGTWRVFTSAGLIIEWGSFNDELRPEGEPSVQEKRESLAHRLNELRQAEYDPRHLKYIALQQPGTPFAPR